MKVKGIKRLLVQLDHLVEDEQINKALNRSCILVENAAKINLTVNGTVDTGALRNSIDHSVEDFVGTVGSNLEYAPYVEFGTGLFASDGDGRKDVPWCYQTADGEWHSTIGQHPQPFLEPALNNNEKQILDIFTKTVNEGIKDAK